MDTLVGKLAPDFTAQAVVNGNNIVENFTLSQFKGQKYVVLFFYPKDFTFVCPTELHAFQEKLEEFKSKNVELIGCSTDTEFSHLAWLQQPRSKGGIKGVQYTLVADTNKTICSKYGVLNGEYFYNDEDELSSTSELIAFRGLYLIDKEGFIHHQIVNNLPLGRNVDEVLRMVDALQHFEKHGEVCPANWAKGKDAIEATHDSVSNYLAKE